MPDCETAFLMLARSRARDVSKATKKPRMRPPNRTAYPLIRGTASRIVFSVITTAAASRHKARSIINWRLGWSVSANGNTALC